MNTKLKDIAKKFIGGQVISRIEAKNDKEAEGEIQILVPKAISNGEIEHTNLSLIRKKTPIDINKLTKTGDVVLKLSQPYDAAYITDSDSGILVTSFCLILRDFEDDMDAKYLVALINSEVYKEQALKLTSGSSVPMLTKGKIESIVVGVPSSTEKTKIVEMYEKIKMKERLFKEILDLENLKLENMLRGEF